jgi:hypothetical protein
VEAEEGSYVKTSEGPLGLQVVGDRDLESCYPVLSALERTSEQSVSVNSASHQRVLLALPNTHTRAHVRTQEHIHVDPLTHTHHMNTQRHACTHALTHTCVCMYTPTHSDTHVHTQK